ncbi:MULTISPECIES: hypothetical protein [Bhargavaea]|uniref:Uncharacterized protein n=1 Tax=Bhargavaea changchunensis TaxID=2134037 RepID=A0ABW2NDK2_9BACL|nr:hypothetical protein [Bhargavaea sp. CC-171006]
MNQIEKQADAVLNTPEYLAGALIIAVGQWNDSGQQDEQLERVATEYLERLQAALRTDRDGAVAYLLGMEVQAA